MIPTRNPTLTLRQLLAAHGIDLDAPVYQYEIRRDAIEAFGTGSDWHRTFTPGPVLDVTFTVDAQPTPTEGGAT
jgi:hypothetical protein